MADDATIGRKISMLRESLRLSVEELAERCDCSADTIRSLEAGGSAPSLASLIKITRALGVRLGTLLDGDTQVGPVIARKDAAAPVQRIKSLETTAAGGVLDFISLAADKTSRHMEPFIVDIHEGAEHHALSSHEGEEFIYVLTGSIEVEYGKDIHVLAEGDSIHYLSLIHI